jgi:hypothetical protein
MLTLADLTELRKLKRGWVTADLCEMQPRRNAYESELRRLAACLLDAAEALLQIKDIKDEETDNDVFSLRVETVLDGLDRSQPPARTDYAATLPHLDAGELADAGKLVGHGRRTP